MPVKLKDDTERKLLASIRRFFLEEMEEDIGDLKARLVLAFFLEEIAPSVYNQAIADAQVFMQARLEDLEATCWQPEFGYWTKRR